MMEFDWTTLNIIAWPAVQLYWMSRAQNPSALFGMALKIAGVAAYSYYCSNTLIPKLGRPGVGFALSYMLPMYVMVDNAINSRLSLYVTYSELLVASAYRFIMEIPWKEKVNQGQLPDALMSPIDETPPYTFNLLGISFSRGMVIDGTVAIVLGPLLALVSNDYIVMKNYNYLGIATLMGAVTVIMGHFSDLKLFSGKSSDYFVTTPGLLQAHLGSTFGWVIHALFMQKLGLLK